MYFKEKKKKLFKFRDKKKHENIFNKKDYLLMEISAVKFYFIL